MLSIIQRKILQSMVELSNKKDVVKETQNVIFKHAGYNIKTNLSKVQCEVFKQLENKKLIQCLQEGGYKIIKNTYNESNPKQITNNESDFDVNMSLTPLKITEEKFQNIKVKILESEDVGKVIPIADIYNGLKISQQKIHNILNSNKEIFYDKKIKLRCTNNVKQICLTKEGIIALFIKIDYKRMKEDKKQLIIDFQNWAIEKLGDLVSKGKVQITNIEQQKIQNTIKESLELTEDDVDKLFSNLEKQLSDISSCLNNLKEVNNKRKEEIQRKDYENTVLKNINNKYRIKTMQLQDRINELRWY